MEHLNAQNDPKQQTKCSGSKSQSCSCSQTLDVKPPKGPVVEKIEKVTLTWESEESNPNEPDVSDGKEVETVPVEQLPDSELPGKSANISHVFLAYHKIWIQFNSWTQKFVEFHCSVDPQNQMFTELHSLIAYCTVTALIGPMAMNVSLCINNWCQKHWWSHSNTLYGPFHYCSRPYFIIFITVIFVL